MKLGWFLVLLHNIEILSLGMLSRPWRKPRESPERRVCPRAHSKVMGQPGLGLAFQTPWARLLSADFSQFSSVAQLYPTLCHPRDCSTPGLPVHHHLWEFTQTHVRWVGDAIQPSHPLSAPSPPAFNLSQHQGLFKWVNSSHEVAKVLDFQLQHQSLQWTPRTDLL